MRARNKQIAIGVVAALAVVITQLTSSNESHTGDWQIAMVEGDASPAVPSQPDLLPLVDDDDPEPTTTSTTVADPAERPLPTEPPSTQAHADGVEPDDSETEVAAPAPAATGPAIDQTLPKIQRSIDDALARVAARPTTSIAPPTAPPAPPAPPAPAPRSTKAPPATKAPASRPPTTAAPTTTVPTKPPTTAAPAPTVPPATNPPRTVPAGQDPVDPGDIIVAIDPSVPLGQREIGQMMVAGRIINGPLPNSITAGPDATGNTLRVGPVADPQNAGRQVLYFGVDVDDPVIFDGTRAHLSNLNQTLPYNETFWHTVSMMHEDWSGTTNNQAILEWHDGDHSSGLSPFLSFYVQGGQLTIAARYANAPNPSRQDMIGVTLFSEPATAANQWQDYVIQGRINPYGGGGGFVRIWRDGVLIVDYQGPIGYDQPGQPSYAVMGYYHWWSYNPFDRRIPVRRTYWAWSSLVRDPSGRYSAADLQAHLATNAG